MIETLKRIKADIITSALLSTALGIVLLVWPAKTIDVVCKILAAVLIIIGLVNLVSYFINKKSAFKAVLGAIVTLVGVWIFIHPESIVSLVPIVIGVMLCAHGVQDVKLAFEAKSNGYVKWWSMLLIALVGLILGIVCISNAFGMVKIALQFIGAAIIYDGVTDIWVAGQTVSSARDKRRQEEILEAEYKEVEPEVAEEKTGDNAEGTDSAEL